MKLPRIEPIINRNEIKPTLISL